MLRRMAVAVVRAPKTGTGMTATISPPLAAQRLGVAGLSVRPAQKDRRAAQARGRQALHGLHRQLGYPGGHDAAAGDDGPGLVPRNHSALHGQGGGGAALSRRDDHRQVTAQWNALRSAFADADQVLLFHLKN